MNPIPILNILNISDIEFLVNNFNLSNEIKNDHQVIGSYTIRYAEFLKPYSEKVKLAIEDKTNFKLSLNYYAIRKYIKGNHLSKHIDNAAPWAVSIPIKQSDTENNSIIFWENELPKSYTLNMGDGIFFNGAEIYHERPPIKSDYLYHVYFGYNLLEHKPKYLL